MAHRDVVSHANGPRLQTFHLLHHHHHIIIITSAITPHLTHLYDPQRGVRFPTQVAHRVGVGHAHGPRLHALVLQAAEALLDAVELLDDLPVVVEQRDGRLLLLPVRQPHGSQGHVLPADLQATHWAVSPERSAQGVDKLAQALVAQHVAAREGVRRLVILQAPLVLRLLPGVGVDVVELHGRAGGARRTLQGALGVPERRAEDGADVARARVARAGVARAVARAEAVRSLVAAAGVAPVATAETESARVAPVTVVVAVAVAVAVGAAQAGGARIAA